jgi:uncharacterized protein YggE
MVPMPQPMLRMSAVQAEAVATPIESGSIEIHAVVTLTVELR